MRDVANMLTIITSDWKTLFAAKMSKLQWEGIMVHGEKIT
jgi:hypothetical protein